MQGDSLPQWTSTIRNQAGQLDGCGRRLQKETHLVSESLVSESRLLQHPAREALGLRKSSAKFPVLASGSRGDPCAVHHPRACTERRCAGRSHTATHSQPVDHLKLQFQRERNDRLGARLRRRSSQSFDPWRANGRGVAGRTEQRNQFGYLRVYVDGHMVETFFGKHSVITVPPSRVMNVVPTGKISSSFVSTAGLKCSNISSWTLSL